ncbi:MAG: efflux RND transporter permease subunit [Candidatus Eremiobacteraeota bacterium]|nr:efflux RND transporter permease subunit [Candidatus Eremiobacteraeota bacterium]
MNRRIAVSMLALAIIVLGIFAIPRLPVALLPNFTQPVVTVQVSYPNVGPEQMESLVTRPIENAVSRVNGIQLISSTSREGQTDIDAQFYFGTNIDTAAVDVQEQVDRIRSQLPNDPNLQQPQISKFDSNAFPVVRGYITDPNMSLRSLGDLFTNQLADEFASIDGVAAVTINNDQQRSIVVEPDANKLAGNGLSLTQITSRIQQENLNLPAGIIQVGKNEYQVRSNALLQSAQEVANLVLATKNGSTIRIGDVAKITDGISEQRSFQRLDGIPAVGINVNAQPNANIVSTAVGIYKKIGDIQKHYPGMHIGIVFDQRGFITESIQALEHTAIYGAVLAVVIILLFLHSWRTTLIVAISLPISVMGTLFVAYIAGYSLNIMTLGGLALAVGLIVDDAIVVIENIYRHMAAGKSPREAAETATAEIFSAILASSITVITVFVPLVLVPGLQGLIFTPFAVMVMAAVGISFVVAVTTVPMLASVLIKNKYVTTNGHTRKGAYARFTSAFDRGYERFAGWYTSVLSRAVDRPALVAAIAAVIFIATLVAASMGAVQTETFPPSNSRYVRFNLQTPTGTALDVTNRTTEEVERRMERDSRVQDVGGQVGTAGFAGNGAQVTNQANLSITLKPGTSGDGAARFVAQWQAALTGQFFARRGGPTLTPEGIKRLRARYGAPIPGLRAFGRTVDIVQGTIARGQDALQIQIYGPDINTLYQLAQFTVIPKLQAIQGLQAPNTSITNAQPEVDVTIDRAKAAQLGLSTSAVSNIIDTATAGTIASFMQINGTQYPIIVQLPPDQRRSLQSIESLSIPVGVNPNANATITQSSSGNGAATSPVTSEGLATLPLAEIATIAFGTGPSQITRQNKQREIEIDAGVSNIPVGVAVKQATQIMNAIALPAGYYWQFGQGVTQQNDTFSSLGLIVLLAIVLIYMLLAAQFESILHPLVIMMSVPLSATGVIVALVLTHRAFGLTAFIGVLMLVGIVVKNAILVVEFTNQLRERGYSPRDAVLRAAPLRLRPILMTTLASVGGMLPIAIGIEAGSQTQAPLGTVVIGGLLCSTMLSLIVVPTFYLWGTKHVEPRIGGFRKHTNGKASALAGNPVPVEI